MIVSAPCSSSSAAARLDVRMHAASGIEAAEDVAREVAAIEAIAELLMQCHETPDRFGVVRRR
jgi:hypothetical protein